MDGVELSVVVPFFNEESTIDEFYRVLKAALEKSGMAYEIIFVNDGSTDGTYRKMIDIFENDKAVLLIKLRKNFGQSAALAAGFDHAKGDFIVTMDGEMQHDPSEIPRFL